MAPKNIFLKFSQLWRVIAPQDHLYKKTGIYFILYPITYRSDGIALQSYIGFYRFVGKKKTLNL